MPCFSWFNNCIKYCEDQFHLYQFTDMFVFKYICWICSLGTWCLISILVELVKLLSDCNVHFTFLLPKYYKYWIPKVRLFRLFLLLVRSTVWSNEILVCFSCIASFRWGIIDSLLILKLSMWSNGIFQHLFLTWLQRIQIVSSVLVFILKWCKFWVAFFTLFGQMETKFKNQNKIWQERSIP